MKDRNRLFRLFWALAFGALLLPLGVQLLGGEEALAAPRANPRKGKVFYKKHCRVCHDGNTADVKMLEPITKTMAQWERQFAEGGEVAKCHPRVVDKLSVELTDQDLLDIQAYLVQHAADSDQPATCGN